MKDKFAKYLKTIDSVCEDAFSITPSDTENQPQASRAVYIGMGGDLNAVLVNSESPVLFKNLASGSLLPVRVKKVLSENTTATALIALI